MARPMHHVGIARFEMTGPDQAALLHWRTRLSAAASRDLAAAFEDAFSGISRDDEVLVIDRLQVDLGECAADTLDLAHLSTALRDALRRVQVQTPTQAASAALLHPPDGTKPTAWRIPLTASAAAALMAYLTTGRLIATAPFPDLAAVYATLNLDQATAGALRNVLLRAPPAARQAAVLRLLATAPRRQAQMLLRMAFPDVAESLFQDAPQHQDISAPSDTVTLPVQARRICHAIANQQPAPETAQPDTAPEPAGFETPDAGTECQNAGLILLHPFLTPYFTGLGLVEGRDFVDPAAQVTAARLLHFLATGVTDTQEPALILPRLICALPDDLPALLMAPLDPDHLAEATRLLEAVIGAWTGLGHTSPDGLRETFLQRPGVLSGPAQAPHLRLERRGVDILLDRLPWSLSLVRLPWMAAPLKVDWA